jgi:hypothetical protein
LRSLIAVIIRSGGESRKPDERHGPTAIIVTIESHKVLASVTEQKRAQHKPAIAIQVRTRCTSPYRSKASAKDPEQHNHYDDPGVHDDEAG